MTKTTCLLGPGKNILGGGDVRSPRSAQQRGHSVVTVQGYQQASGKKRQDGFALNTQPGGASTETGGQGRQGGPWLLHRHTGLELRTHTGLASAGAPSAPGSQMVSTRFSPVIS